MITLTPNTRLNPPVSGPLSRQVCVKASADANALTGEWCNKEKKKLLCQRSPCDLSLIPDVMGTQPQDSCFMLPLVKMGPTMINKAPSCWKDLAGLGLHHRRSVPEIKGKAESQEPKTGRKRNSKCQWWPERMRRKFKTTKAKNEY